MAFLLHGFYVDSRVVDVNIFCSGLAQRKEIMEIVTGYGRTLKIRLDLHTSLRASLDSFATVLAFVLLFRSLCFAAVTKESNETESKTGER